MALAAIIGTPIAIVLGYACGAVLNRAKGREMVTGYILGFFVNGIYQLVVLYCMGNIIPIKNPILVLSRGYGIRNAINLSGIRHVLDNAIPLNIMPPLTSLARASLSILTRFGAMSLVASSTAFLMAS